MFIFKSEISITSQYFLIGSFSKVPKASDNSVGIMTTEGSRDLAFDEYLDIIKSFNVDSAVSFSDEVPITIGKRRGKQSIARSKAWLQQQLERSDKKSRIIANIQATDNMELLQEQISLVNEHSDELFGVNISGLHLGESPQQREKILSAIYSSIPAVLVRFVTGPNSPREVLDSIRLGTDIAVCSYPVTLAEKAYASLYEPFSILYLRRFSNESIFCNEQENIQQETKMNLLDNVYKDDKSLLVEGCDCYACKRFTKGYIHHLFNCHEMLGVILLTQHNMHHFLKFLQSVRQMIREGRLDEAISHKEGDN
ncbi:uncharacterized protein [Blastocystis hominis]|uniref:tRNA-guanine(15) transglycosylase-like domain-containing protein n=1 Tax=Blastocystis hominis TaxID=12968 RepID=D8M4Z8_BLAHO|nr:uncharacterized protein [Blastocystis hominis]CBK23137.2 unnamed protein product [Blastocystis hominis]|eukprot:XP_012897185.1 uncharacterized protein [Blastocystis hominis]